MTSCRPQCTSVAIIVGILSGFILGVLSALCLISTSLFFWAYLTIGVAEVLLAPIYANNKTLCTDCFCSQISLITIATVGTILFSVIGLIIENFVSITSVAIIFGIASFFVVSLLALLICVAICKCEE